MPPMIRWADGFGGSGDATTLARGYASSSLAGAVFNGAGRFGGYSLGNAAGGDTMIRTRSLALADAQEIVVGFAVRAGTMVDAASYLALLDSGGATMLALELFSGGSPGWDARVRVGDTVLATTARYAADTWIACELYVRSSTGNDGVVEWRVNGVTELRVEGVRTSGAGVSSVDALQISLQAAATSSVYLADLVVADGPAVLGDLVVDTVWPVGAVRYADLDGWAGTDPHHEQVDDASARTVDDDATYLTTTGAAIGSQFFRFGEHPRARGHILAVVAAADLRRESAGSHGVLVGRLAPDGSVTTHATPITVTSTSYVRESRVFPDLDGVPWTREDVEAQDWGWITGDGAGLRMTRATLEIVGRAPAVVAPRALGAADPPFLRPNWAAGVTVETSWVTDMARGAEAIGEDRRSLASRPVRRVTADLLGISASASALAVLGAGRRGITECPGLLWTDRTRLTAATGVGPEVYCDTRWRRFALGQRVLVVGPGGESPEWLEIAGVRDDHLIATSAPTLAHASGALVYPTVDAELLLDATADVLDGRTADLRLVTAEAQGASALPALWDDPEIGGYPVGPGGDPVFTVRPNRSEGVRLSLRREATRDGTGRGSVISAHGARPRWTVGYEATALDREAAWALLRFVESRRGRARPFWLLSPMVLLQFDSATTTYVRVVGSGDPSDLADLVDHVAVVGRDQTSAIAEVASVGSIGGGLWEITFATPITLPPQPYAVSAAYHVRLASDTHTERWITDGVCSVALEFDELLDEAAVVISDLGPTAHSFGAPAEIPDLHFWFDSQDNCFDFDALTNGYRRASAWPSKWHKILAWADRRVSLPDFVPAAGLPRSLLTNAATGGAVRPYLANFELPWLNSGHRIAMNAGPLRYAPLLDTSLAPRQREWWSNTAGMTLVLAWIGGTQAAAAGDRVVIRLTSGGQECFLWVANDTSFQSRVQLYAVPGTVVGGYGFTCGSIDEVAMSVAILRWTPGGACQLYRNGVLQGSLAAGPSSFPQVLSYDDLPWFDYFAISQPAARGIADDNHFKRPILSSFLAYRRALTNSECNSVMAFLSSAYGIPYTPL